MAKIPIVTYVPAAKEAELKLKFNIEAMLADEKDAIVYQFIQDNNTLPLIELKSQLYKRHKLRKTVGVLKKIAINCGLPYTE